ncbi:MAG: sigma-70 family RNA polymerase sigma factor [Bacteroidetes bacterium]|nr:sigma-70 family RNA polymerase sigma factor [Bacteroidota bacterium]
MPAYSEHEIIAGCRDQNRAIQEHLYKIYYSLFLKICARYAKDMQDAEQLLNDGFLKIFTNINKFGDQGSFEGWMKRVMVNTCLDYLRSKYLKQEMVMHVHAIPAEQSNLSISNEVFENLEFKELVRVVQSLPAMTRTVFNLFVFEGYNHAEIAAQFNISEKTSQWHVHQARYLLQKKIKKNDSLKVTYETK